MVWFKVDDTLAFHAKVVAAGNPAMGLWVRAGAWAAQQLTDGHVPEHMVKSLGTPRQAASLVTAGLWVQAAGGYQFHDWTDGERQPTRQEIESKRQAWRDKKKEQRAKGTAKSGRDLQGRFSVPGGQVEESPGESTGESPLSRPVPSRPKVKRAHPADGAGADDEPKPQTIEHQVTDWAYTKTGKAFDFIKTRAITKWAIHDKAADPNTVAKALVAVYEAGRPITKTTLGQYLDGHSPETKADTRPGASSWNRKLVPCTTCGGKHPEGAICE